MSKYNEIQTAKDLIREVISHGLSTVQEDKNRAADIIGNSGIGELAELANNENEIGRKRVGETFYFILFSIWNWREATDFYNKHSNSTLQDAKQIKKERDDLFEKANALHTTNQHLGDERDALLADCEQAQGDLAAAKQEITTLKAKLYDLMTAGA